jgi:hypothetical protein
MRARPLSLGLAAANLAVAALALWPVMAPVGAASMAPAAAPARADRPAPGRLGPSASFDAIAARPLFSPTRRPDASAPAGGLAARYRLIGIVTVRDRGRVLLAPIAGGRAIELGKGDALEGWTLKRIERNGALFASPAGEAALAVTPPP